MKRIYTLLYVACILSIGNLSSQSNNVYNIRNNVTGELLKIRAMVEGENNNIYAVGEDYSTHNNYLLKIDDYGSLVWHKQLKNGDSLGSLYYSQLEFYNNELYVLGYSNLYSLQYLVIKADLNGNQLWSKNLSPVGTSVYQLPSLSVKPNSGIIVSNSCHQSIDLFSLTLSGSTNWIRSFNTDSMAGKNPNFDITVTDEGNIMGCTKAAEDMSFYCMSSNGTLIWARRVLEIDGIYTQVKSIVEIDNNKFFICGFRSNNLLYGNKGFYAFMDSTGSFTDFRIVNEVSEIKNAIVLNNGNLLLNSYDGQFHSRYLIIDNWGNFINGYYSPTNLGTLSYNEIVQTSNYTYLANDKNIQKVVFFDSVACLNLLPQPISFLGDDPSTAPITGHYSMNSGGSIADYTQMQFLLSNLQLEVVCGPVVVEENNANPINIFPTVLHNNESIFVNHNLENVTIDYQILDLNGKVVALNSLKDNSISINGLNAGMYIIQFAVKGNVVKSDKFVVVD